LASVVPPSGPPPGIGTHTPAAQTSLDGQIGADAPAQAALRVTVTELRWPGMTVT
jgi:hypothetical protein